MPNHSRTPKTLVIGAKGFLGSHFLKAYRLIYPDTLGITRETLDLNAPNLDSLHLNDYEYALIGAAVTSIAQCEKEKETSFSCNVTGTLKLAQELRKKNIIPILFSTDYVYDGISGNYDEESPLSPLNEYGRQKAELQRRLPEVCGNDFLLIRPSKVYGSLRGDGTLLDEMICKLRQKKPIQAAHDQIFSPILVTDLINGVIELQKKHCRGIFHICSEICSRFEISQRISKKLGFSNELIQAISLDDLKESFKRPKNTSLNCQKFQSSTGLVFRSIKDYIEAFE